MGIYFSKIKSYCFLILFFGCVQLPIESQPIIQFKNPIISFDQTTNAFFLQIELDYLDTVHYNSVFADITDLSNSELLESITLKDEGINNDIVANNNIFSFKTTSIDFGNNQVTPKLQSIALSDTIIQLADSVWVWQDIEILTHGAKKYSIDFSIPQSVDYEPLNIEFTLVDHYILLLVNSHSMYKDITEDGTCERTQFNGFNAFEILDTLNLPGVSIHSQESSNGNTGFSKFQTQIPYRSISECGGVGSAQFKFEVRDQNHGIKDWEIYNVKVVACGDGLCFDGYENVDSCLQDCGVVQE